MQPGGTFSVPEPLAVALSGPSFAYPSLHSGMRNRCFLRQKEMQRMRKETPGSRYPVSLSQASITVSPVRSAEPP